MIAELRDDRGWTPPRCDADGVYVAGSGPIDVSYTTESLEILAAHAEASWWHDHRSRWVERALRAHDTSSLVEVGAGTGGMSVRLAAAGVDVLAVEPHHPGARRIVQDGVPAICGSLAASAFPDASIEALGYFDVLEHIDASDTELREARRVLRPDGLLFATVPAFSWLWSNEDELAGHVRRYTKKTLSAELQEAGFEVVSLEYIFASLVLPAFALRRIPYLINRRRGKQQSSKIDGQLDPPRLISSVLDGVMRAETAVARFVTLPAGLSIAGIFKKTG